MKTRYEEIADIASYFHTLPPSAKKFMHSFVEEYVNANFNHKGKQIYTEVEDKRAIYNRNNARNRDVLTKAKASGQYISVDDPDSRKMFTNRNDNTRIKEEKEDEQRIDSNDMISEEAGINNYDRILSTYEQPVLRVDETEDFFIEKIDYESVLINKNTIRRRQIKKSQ